MRKTISIIVFTASLLASLTVFVCYNPENEEVGGKKGYVNPLDEKGSNYLGDYMSGLNGLSDKDKERCLKPDPNGNPTFWSDTTCLPSCDGVNPGIKIVGKPSVTTTTKPGDEASANELKKWLHLDGGNWKEIVYYDSGKGGTQQPYPPTVSLTKDGGEDIDLKTLVITKDTIRLEPNTYTITYKVVKDTCIGKIPSAVVTRSLIVNKYIPPVGGEITIMVNTPNPAQIYEGNPYTDQGADVYIGTTPIPSALDSVVVRDSKNNVVSRVVKPNGDFSKVKLSDNPKVGDTFTVTYYANYPGMPSKTAVRSVEVIVDQTTLPAVIALNNYTYKLKSGKEAKWPDTMLYNWKGAYVEKGAKAYKNTGSGIGDEITGPNVVTITTPEFGDNVTKQVDYRVEAGNGYGAASKKRNVHMVDTCEDKTAPEVRVSNSNWRDDIPAGTPWDYDKVWIVTSKDENIGNGFKYFIDFDGLDPDKPVPKSGGYKITFVGLGRCGGVTELTKTLTVK